MKTFRRCFLGSLLIVAIIPVALAGKWSDDFSRDYLGAEWGGDTAFFSITEGALKGVSISPLAPAPLHILEVGSDWSNYTVDCDIDVVTPNFAVCTKGALILRHSGSEAYLFAVHVATKTLEVYRLSDHKMLLQKDAPLELKRWYHVRAELAGETMTFYVDGALLGTVRDAASLTGRVGVAVQDAAEVRFDNFVVSGPEIPTNGLVAEKAPDKILLRWPIGMSNYVLKATLSIGSTSEWQPIAEPIVHDQGYYQTLVDPVGMARFFRLFSAAP